MTTTVNAYKSEQLPPPLSFQHNPRETESIVPGRYYTPQPGPRRSSLYLQNYTPTPNPETVVIQKRGVVSDKYPCCIGCLLACFFCFMVKNESAVFEEKANAGCP